jgi:CHAT domain-containing protein
MIQFLPQISDTPQTRKLIGFLVGLYSSVHPTVAVAGNYGHGVMGRQILIPSISRKSVQIEPIYSVKETNQINFLPSTSKLQRSRNDELALEQSLPSPSQVTSVALLEEAARVLSAGKPRDALELIQKALILDPMNSNAYFTMGTAYFLINLPTQALNAYERATSLRPNFWESLNNQGLIYFELGLTHKAVDCWRRVLMINPSASEASLALAAALHSLGYSHNAETIYLANTSLATSPIYINQDYQKQQLWGMRLRKAAQRLFSAPEMKLAVAKARMTSPQPIFSSDIERSLQEISDLITKGSFIKAAQLLAQIRIRIVNYPAPNNEALLSTLDQLEKMLRHGSEMIGYIEANKFTDAKTRLHSIQKIYHDSSRNSATNGQPSLFDTRVQVLNSILDIFNQARRTPGRDRLSFGGAREAIKKTTVLLEHDLGRNDPLTLNAHGATAKLAVLMGFYGEAEDLLESSLNKLDIHKVDNNNKPILISLLSRLAELRIVQGRSAEAEVLLGRALTFCETYYGKDSLESIDIYLNLADVYIVSRNLASIPPLLKKVAAILERSQLSGGEESAQGLLVISDMYLLQGRLRDAEASLREVLRITKTTVSDQHPSYHQVLARLGYVNLMLGHAEEAEFLFGESYRLFSQTHGPEASTSFAALQGLVMSSIQLKKFAAARSYFAILNSSQAKYLRRELVIQPRELRSVLLAKQLDIASLAFTLFDQDEMATNLALETRFNRQGLLAEIERQQALLKTSSSETLRLAEQIAQIDRLLASVSLQLSRREPLRIQRQQLEAQLYRLLPELKIDPVSNAQVASALKAAAPQGLLVEFQKYRPYVKDAKAIPNWGIARYVALLLKPNGTITAIPLGEAKAIDEAVNTALAATVKNEQRQTQALTVLSQRILGPLQPHLNGVKVLFLSPDGELNRVPFAALPSPMEPGRYLSEAFQLRILTTGRDLVRLQQPNQAAGSQPAGSNVLMADPEFGPITGASSTPTLPAWLPLPYTSAEAEQLKGLLNVPEPFLGREATAARVLRTRGPRILHIATHGYFQPEAVTTSVPRLRASSAADGSGFATALINQPNSQLQLESQEPLQRIYLALAGANIPTANAADDGRLTAAEATGMDLAGTELVTLSACDTARGEIRSGEGVYGLQRALTVAGARSTLLSLWRVGDQRTAVFMEEFYKRLKAGQPRADALRDTQAFFRKHPDSTYRDVYAWGGFQLTGDWRPVEGL